MPKICDMGQTALFPLRRKACCGIFRMKNPTAAAGFEPAILGTRGQHELDHWSRSHRWISGIGLLTRDFGSRRLWMVSTMLRPLYPWENPVHIVIRGWVGPRDGLGICEIPDPTGFDPRIGTSVVLFYLRVDCTESYYSYNTLVNNTVLQMPCTFIYCVRCYKNVWSFYQNIS
jgi:hypothetical protein